MMERWLRVPLNKLSLIDERLDAVEYLINDSVYWIVDLGITTIINEFSGIRNGVETNG